MMAYNFGVVVRDAGEILLICRTNNGNWALPGGAIDLGESVAQAAVRETLGESGIERDHRHRRDLLGPPARDPLHQQRRGTPGVLHRPHRPAVGRTANAKQPVKRRPLGPGSRTPGYTMDRSMRIRINDFLAHGQFPVIT
jgi:8-oxo-dGTP pyrophosphatase MutT (NUDIX family)